MCTTVMCVGTGSQIKIDAVKEVFPDFEIISFDDVVSGVPSQPKGLPETTTGARNRAMAACERYVAASTSSSSSSPFFYCIGIENGIWTSTDDSTAAPLDSSDNVDVAVVVLLKVSLSSSIVEEHVVLSEALPVPFPLPAEIHRGRNGEWSHLKDPHSVVTNGAKSRKDFLVEALQALRGKCC